MFLPFTASSDSQDQPDLDGVRARKELHAADLSRVPEGNVHTGRHRVEEEVFSRQPAEVQSEPSSSAACLRAVVSAPPSMRASSAIRAARSSFATFTLTPERVTLHWSLPLAA